MFTIKQLFNGTVWYLCHLYAGVLIQIDHVHTEKYLKLSTETCEAALKLIPHE